jgi:hypothetical protein
MLPLPPLGLRFTIAAPANVRAVLRLDSRLLHVRARSWDENANEGATVSFGKVVVLVLALALGGLGIGAAFADPRGPGVGVPIDLVDDARKSEVDDDVLAAQEDVGDEDETRGNDGTNGGDNTGSPAPAGGGGGGDTGGDADGGTN